MASGPPRKSERQLIRDWWCERARRSAPPKRGHCSRFQVVVDSAASFGVASAKPDAFSSAPTRSHLLVFSANHPDSLRRSVTDYQQYVASSCASLADLAHTLGCRREHLIHQAFCVTDGKAPLEITPFVKSKPCQQINFVFTGQGAQWAGMAKDLLDDFPRFRDDIKAMERFSQDRLILHHGPLKVSRRALWYRLVSNTET